MATDWEKGGVVKPTSPAESKIVKLDDAEKLSVQHGEAVQLKRRLKSRHLQMIAIGGTIGTGLFIGTGLALSKAGPAGILIAFIFIGTLIYSVMVALGEMATYMPVAGAFTVYAARFVDRSLGFSMGWIYWFSWAITYALELTASGFIIQYWAPNVNIGIFIGVFWAVITAVNLLPVSFYGELEFWFAMIKVVTIIGFLIFGICIDAGASDQGYLGFHYWGHPGAFAPYLITDNDALAKFVGFWSVLITAGFSYQGTELVGIAAGECENPRKTVPSAIRKTVFRILIFFIGTVFFIGLLVPYDNPSLQSSDTNATASPLVIAAQLAGVKVLPSLINAVLLTTVLSAANSDVYSASRILVGLAEEKSAPKFITWTTKGGVPYIAVLFSAAFGLLGFLNLSNGGTVAFNWFLNISSVAGFIAWACIVGSHLRFMKGLRAQGISRDSLAYKASWQPWYSWYGLLLIILIVITQGFTAFIPWSTSDFFAAYVSLILFVVLYAGHKLFTRCPLVSYAEMDLVTGVREVDEMYANVEDTGPRTWYGKAWDVVMG